MAEDRVTLRKEWREHCIVAEQKLFDAIEMFSAKEDITAADASALAALTGAMLSVQGLMN